MQCTFFCMDWPWDPFVLFWQLFSLYWGGTTLILVLIITLLTFVRVWMTTGLADREKLLDNFQHRRDAISITPSWQVTFAAYWWSKAPPSWTETNQCGCSTPHRLHNTCRVSPAQGWACLVTGIVLQKSRWSMMKVFLSFCHNPQNPTQTTSWPRFLKTRVVIILHYWRHHFWFCICHCCISMFPFFLCRCPLHCLRLKYTEELQSRAFLCQGNLVGFR